MDAVPTKKTKTIPDDALPHKYEVKKMDDGGTQYLLHKMQTGIYSRKRADPPVTTLLPMKPQTIASLYPQAASNLNSKSEDTEFFLNTLHMQFLIQSTRVAVKDCREEADASGFLLDFEVQDFSLDWCRTPGALKKINENFEVVRRLGIDVVEGTFSSKESFWRIPPSSNVRPDMKHLVQPLSMYKNYYAHVLRLLSEKDVYGIPCDYGENSSMVAAAVAALKLLINSKVVNFKQPGPNILEPIKKLMEVLIVNGVNLPFTPDLIPGLKYEQLKLLAAATKKLLVTTDAGKRKVVPYYPPLFLVSCPSRYLFLLLIAPS